MHGRLPLSLGLARPARWLVLCLLVPAAVRAERVLVDFDAVPPGVKWQVRDGKVQLVPHAGGKALQLTTGHAQPWPGVTLWPEQGLWDLSPFAAVSVEVHNIGQHAAKVGLRIDSRGPRQQRPWVQATAEVPPGQKTTILVHLKRRLPDELAQRLFGMRGYPGGMSKDRGLDAAHIDRVSVFLSRPEQAHRLVIDRLVASGSWRAPWAKMSAEAFFPMIDRYGQFIHDDWPGKIHSDADFAVRAKQESADLASHPGPKDRDRFGGWAAGPRLQATGYFRTVKRSGRWWLVDPDGRLFWSHGIDCVRSSSGYTPITDREFYFAELPPRQGRWAQFYGRRWGAARGYYQAKRYETFNFTGANLLRKYGADWQTIFAELCHRRLRSWGLNTIGNWSAPEIYLLDKTPYVATVHTGGPYLEGSEGYWGKFPDPFAPQWQDQVKKRVAALRKQAGDPWCLGYFVDNELSWGDELSLAAAALRSPPSQPAKRVMVEDLRNKYRQIQQLNAAWQTQYASWDDLLQRTESPPPQRAREDLARFYTRIAEQYFRVCRDAVKQVAPDHLYLGCRFAWVNDRAIRAAARYCDVISFNRYRDSVADFRLPEGIDKPVIIGEFHFGALDRGMFHTGLRPTANQQERAAAYRRYVAGALQNPLVVGTHWFQFGDQATTGRNDGENYQIGFVDICDTPYWETIAACREIGDRMYRLRGGQAQ